MCVCVCVCVCVCACVYARAHVCVCVCVESVRERERQTDRQTPSTGLDILPPTIAIVDYAIGLEKLSANEQFGDDAQTAISL